ncbi:MAG: transcription termination factor NusA [bacterium]
MGTVLSAINQMSQSLRLSKEHAIELFKDTIKSVVKTKLGENVKSEVNISEKDGSIELFLIKKVVTEPINLTMEISLKEAKEIIKTAALDKEIKVKIPFESLGRGAVILTRQLLEQKIKEKEKEKVKEVYTKKTDEIIVGTVQKVDKNEIIAKLKDAEGILPAREQIPGERYNQGDPIKGYILDVTSNGEVLMSRSHPNLLKKLLEKEIPEIQENVIQIKAVARIPGIRAKVAVISNDVKIEPVGACVGVRGSRIEAIMKELNNERIDVIQYSTDLKTLVSRVLSNVTILKSDVDKDNKKMSVIVKDEDLPKAIGKGGQNALLASKLTGYKIDIISESKFKNKGITFIKELDSNTKNLLVNNGFMTTADILEKGIEQLAKVPEIGEERASEIYHIVSNQMQNTNEKVEIDNP